MHRPATHDVLAQKRDVHGIGRSLYMHALYVLVQITSYLNSQGHEVDQSVLLYDLTQTQTQLSTEHNSRAHSRDTYAARRHNTKHSMKTHWHA